MKQKWILTILFACAISISSFAQDKKEWQLSFGLIPVEQVFAKTIIDGIKPANPYQLDGFLPIGNFIVSRNFTQNSFSFMIESFSGFMRVKSKEVATQQTYAANCLNSGLLFGAHYCWSSFKMKIYSGFSIGGQLLYLWENQKDKRTLMKVPAFHIQAIEFQFSEKINWNVGIGFGSKGIVNIGIVLP